MPDDAEPARIIRWNYLSVSDCPLSIAVLVALRGERDWRPIGMRSGPSGGVDLSWELLLDSHLSSTEKAAVRLVEATYRLEGRGGLPQRVHAAVAALMADLLAS